MKCGVSVKAGTMGPEHPQDTPEYSGTPPDGLDPPGTPLITKVRRKKLQKPKKKNNNNNNNSKIINESINMFIRYLENGRLGQFDEFTQLKDF